MTMFNLSCDAHHLRHDTRRRLIGLCRRLAEGRVELLKGRKSAFMKPRWLESPSRIGVSNQEGGGGARGRGHNNVVITFNYFLRLESVWVKVHQ